MASKKTVTKKSAPAKKKAPAKKTAAKKAPKEKVEAKPVGPRHPKARVADIHGGKEALAKTLAASLATETEDSDTVAGKLKTASNMQLLRLQRVVLAVKDKWVSREKLIEAISSAEKKSKDKDYLAKLGSFPLPRLYDLAQSAERRARA
ncbi:MAG TPA: hypothetical protein VLB44_02600 [Kofleriaceae bacterium]|nr:hypothetical protein [Kofleriaceae bacterium]